MAFLSLSSERGAFAKARTSIAGSFTPKSISGLALWLDAADSQSLYTTDAGPVTAVSAPTDISGCVGWWDASDASKITASGGLVSQWDDKSGQGNHATASGTARPTLTSSGLNGRSVLTFDGTANAMTVAANSAFNSNNLTFFIVFKQDSVANKGVYTKLNATPGTLGFGLVVRSDPQVWLLQKNASAAQVLTASINPTTQARIYSVTSSTAAAGFLDGLSTVNATGQTADHSLNQNVTIGARAASEFLNGYIAEIIHFNTALSTANLARVEAYLAAKWGISGVHAQATATGDPVGYWKDKSGNGRHAVLATSASRPTISATTTNGKKALAFNGSSSTLAIANYSAESSLTGLTRYMVMSQSSGLNFLTGTGGSGGTFMQQVSFQGRFFAGSAYGAVGMPLYAFLTAGTRIVGSVYDGTAGSIASGIMAYGDGASLPQEATSGTLPTTLASGSPTYYIGSNLNVNNFFSGRTLEVLTYNRALKASERRSLERYLANKWGITLAPQVSNADAQDWINRVYANGGTVSAGTASAVSAFCDAIDAAGLRASFYRLNLFCGTGLNAALVPLYRGPSLGGTQYGNAADTNVGGLFVSGDYNETGASGGLKGNGSTKYLDTGFAANTLGQTDRHISAFFDLSTSLNNRYWFGSDQAGCGSSYWALGSSSTSSAEFRCGIPGAGSVAASGKIHIIVSGNGTAQSYLNGSASTSISGTAFTAPSQSIYVHAINRCNAPADYGSCRVQAYSLGTAMAATQAANFYTALAAFQSAMSRT